LKKVRWYLEMALFLVLSRLIAWLPGRSVDLAGPRIGRLFFRLLKGRRQVAVDNIEASLPFLEAQPGWVRRPALELARESFENLGRSLVEDCRVYHGRGRQLIDRVEFRGLDNFERAFAKGKGVAFITAHCGNWDLLALTFGVRVRELSVVARRQDNPYLNDVLERIRKAYGNRVLYKQSALRAMLAAFKRQEIVGMLIDQAASPDEGVLVEFLGRPAWATRLPAYIAKKSGTPLVPAFIHREGELQVMTFHPELATSGAPDPNQAAIDDVVALNRHIERYIVEHPTEWYWIHKRWKYVPAAPVVAQASTGADHAH
jgi:KDO2-lipid IV(A) lauroyltransferase